MRDLSKALSNVDATYDQVKTIANDMITRYTAPGDGIIKTISDNVSNLSNEALREAMLRLSLVAYSFGEIKEKSAFKAECAEMLRKEKYAVQFNATDGSVAYRDNTALLNSSEEIVVEALYNLVSSALKTKLDEMHRVVDTLKTIMVSRMSEAKLLQADNGQEE